ncbi:MULTISPECIES: TetR/AcrR family transcriptional regulator [Aestuariimicrobium]|uniref:TetR/AcrR family transcriptional regulator n=1 Tax=Aestuariimicrobium TaxID=396388 RepID=UPI000407784F|nr:MULTISPECIES: TetR/AcrR family transcriptional regulator [Aestuariimicrobium]
MTRPKLHDETLREALIEEASKVIARHGPDSLNLRRVATATGTSTTAIYSLFGSKDELVSAVTITSYESLAASQAAVPTTDDAFADLCEIGRDYRRWALKHPHFYVGMFREQALSLSASTPTAMDPVKDCIRRCIDEDLFRGDVYLLSMLFWSIVHGFVVLEIEGHFEMLPDHDALYETLLLANAAGWVTEAHNAEPRSSDWLHQLSIRMQRPSVA